MFGLRTNISNQLGSLAVFKDKPRVSTNWDELIYNSALGGTTAPNKFVGFSGIRHLAGTKPEPEEQESALRFVYIGQVSMRVIKGKVQSADFETFQFLDVRNEVADVGEKSSASSA